MTFVIAEVPAGKWRMHLASSMARHNGYVTEAGLTSFVFSQAWVMDLEADVVRLTWTRHLSPGTSEEIDPEEIDPEDVEFLQDVANAPAVPTPNRAKGETHTSASYLKRVHDTTEEWWEAWEYRPELGSIGFRARIKGMPSAAIYDDGWGRVTRGKVSRFVPGTRFTFSWHACDGTVKAAVTRVPKTKTFQWDLKRDRKRGVDWVGPFRGTYLQTTVTRAGAAPDVRRYWVKCSGKNKAADATWAVDRWGEVMEDPLYTGRRIKVAKTVVAPGAKVSRTWYVGKRRLATTGRSLTVRHAWRTKKVRLVVKVKSQGRTLERTHVFGPFWDGR
ncbi:hypothetical protein [Nocardioides yefusunii]|uniref:Uncharacterized protein n=1 Tax=Nocardioides yefusunii TaxID=2500546 RepID=A0ABW1QXH9_9ACTN|nr:hypothetical protein [Nocardioides yefusunii]